MLWRPCLFWSSWFDSRGGSQGAECVWVPWAQEGGGAVGWATVAEVPSAGVLRCAPAGGAFCGQDGALTCPGWASARSRGAPHPAGRRCFSLMVFLRNEEGCAGRGLRLPMAAPMLCTRNLAPNLARCQVCVSFRPSVQAGSARPGLGDVPPLPKECHPQRPQLAVSTAECPQPRARLLPLPLPCEWVAHVTFRAEPHPERSLSRSLLHNPA